jgi:hypothetical protein
MDSADGAIDSGPLTIGETWNLPHTFITGLCVAVIAAPENKHEFVQQPLHIMLFGRRFEINDLWGKKSEVQKIISAAFHNPKLFDKKAELRASLDAESGQPCST